MTRMLFAALLLVLSTFVAWGQTPMTAAEFEAYTTGKTLTYSSDGRAYGIEEYRQNRRVRWAYLDGECQEGEWYPAGELICFVYDSIEDHQCWTFFREGTGLRALFMNDPAETELYETRAADSELLCLGPKIGV